MNDPVNSSFRKKKYPALYFLMALFLVQACNPVPEDKRIKQVEPALAVSWAKDIEEQVNPELEEGLTLQIWGPDSLVADPITIDVDDQGHIYYSRTNRRRVSEFDIRSHQDWEISSIGFQSVEDRRAFIRRELDPANSDKNQWLPDLNQDGSHDWRDATVEKENVYRLEDTDGDGVADLSQLVVQDFHEEVTDVAGAVMKHGEDLFVGVAPDMWRMQDTNGDGIMDKKTSIAHGFGVHIGFGGHNMSGLTLGPDGRIYWSIGDIGFRGSGVEGEEWKDPNSGVIVRANPDGTDFEVFASGLRNVHEFVFDEYANLISVDNDGDHAGETERLVYIVNGSDAGWRINWQFGKYRDPKNNSYKVWMDEGLYKTRFEGQAAYITPAIANYVNGPTGMLYNPGTALAPRWKNTFFVVEFVGGPAQSGLHTFKLKPKGATFELAETSKILGGVLATGMDFGPDGSIYVADWIDGWVNKGYGRIWKLDDMEGAQWEERKRTQQIFNEDLSEKDLAFLDELLKYPDLRIRQKAQFELVERGKRGAEIFEKNIRQTDHQLARIHGIIGLSQLARLENMDYAASIVSLLEDKEPEIRAQAAKWLGDIRYKDADEALLPLLKDENSRVSFFAAEALGRVAYEPAIPGLIELLARNNDEDAFVRHAVSLALARIGKAEPIVALADHPSRAVRIGAVVALRRMSHPGVSRFLNDEDEFIVTDAARAINDDFSIEEALPALAALLNQTSFTNEALIRRAINANLRLGSAEAMQQLLVYSRKADAPVSMRTEALEALGTWANPSVLDRVDGRYRGEMERDITLLRSASEETLLQLLADANSQVRLTAVETIGKIGLEAGNPIVVRMLEEDSSPQVREAALRSLLALKESQKAEAIKQALADPEKEVRVAGLDLLKDIAVEEQLKVELLSEVIEKRTMEEKQAAVQALTALSFNNSRPLFEKLIGRLEAGSLPAEIQLELSEALESIRDAELLQRNETYYKGLSRDSLVASYAGSLYGGDEELGRRIFFRNQSAQCVRCHAYDDMGGGAGPPINGVGTRLSRQQLLEAMIEPSKRLAPGYGVVTLDLDNGSRLTGVLGEEDANSLSLKIGNLPDTVVQKANITNRMNAPSSMPDMKHILSRREIRDLVSFLATLKEEYNE
jgi:quinoprotein glucose dehydrogenase